MKAPLVSVVIPTYNSASTLPKTVEALYNQDYPRELLEIVVVDDGSTDKTREVLQGYPIRYFHQGKAGPAKARNTGWKNSRGDIICFTDADCIPQRNWVSELVHGYQDDRVGAVGGSYGIANKENILADCIYQEIIQRHSIMPLHPKVLGSYNFSARKGLLQELNGFNEEYTMASGEDNDLSYRIRKKGYSLVFNREARVAHYHPQRFLKYLRTQFWHGYWRVKLYREHADMVGGDDYSSPWDYLQPVAGVFLCVSMLGVWFGSWGRMLFTFFLLLELVLQVPLAWKTVVRTRNIVYLSLIPITFFRAMARGAGLCLGAWHFGIKQGARRSKGEIC
jgi:glycosyltransferase involved in cell wall biosynthesis